MALWVATRNGQDVGRIAGILDRNHNQTQKNSAVFFGFFECVDDREVSRRLFREGAELGAEERDEARSRADESDDE